MGKRGKLSPRSKRPESATHSPKKETATLTEDLARFALRVRREDVPDDVVALAKEHLLDILESFLRRRALTSPR